MQHVRALAPRFTPRPGAGLLLPRNGIWTRPNTPPAVHRSINWVDPYKQSSTALTPASEAAPSGDNSRRLGLLVGLPVALAVAALVVTVAGLYWWRKGARLRARAKALKTFTEAPGPGPDTALVLTDIEGSTVLVRRRAGAGGLCGLAGQGQHAGATAWQVLNFRW